MDASVTTTSPSRYADLRAASQPSRRVTDKDHRYHTKFTHMSPQQPHQLNTSAFAFNPHWSNSRVVPLANPSEDDPRVVMPLSKRDLWKTTQRAAAQAGGPRVRKHHSDRPDRLQWSQGDKSSAAALRCDDAGGNPSKVGKKAAKAALASSTASLPGDEPLSQSQSQSLTTALSTSADIGAEVRFWRGKEAADELVDGALRKWKTQRKDRVEKMGWTVVLDGADGEGAIYDKSGAHDDEEDWEVLSA